MGLHIAGRAGLEAFLFVPEEFSVENVRFASLFDALVRFGVFVSVDSLLVWNFFVVGVWKDSLL